MHRFWKILFLLPLFFQLTSIPVGAYEILMFGDSITQGLQRNSSLVIYGITSPPNGARVNGSYGPRLETLLNQLETTHAYNWGWMGEKTSTGVSRINTVLSSRAADYILILEGANDLMNGVSRSTTVTNLGIMIDKAKNAGITPILSEVTPLTCPRVCGYNVLVTALNEQVTNLASEKNVVLSEIFTPISAGWTSVPYTSGDGIHISNAGYLLMANKWYEAIIYSLQSRDIMSFIKPLLMKK